MRLKKYLKIKLSNLKRLTLLNLFTLSLSVDGVSEMIDLLNKEFTEKQAQHYILNIYMSLNFHPTLDFPISLDHVYKDLGFANKGNAMKTIKSNFTKDEDYKIILFPREKKQNAGKKKRRYI